jgi:hypothetical protein
MALNIINNKKKKKRNVLLFDYFNCEVIFESILHNESAHFYLQDLKVIVRLLHQLTVHQDLLINDEVQLMIYYHFVLYQKLLNLTERKLNIKNLIS